MGAAYNILGKMVPSHVLALGTVGAVVGGVVIPPMFQSADVAAKAPVETAAPASNDEFDVEKSINEFLASSDKEQA